MNFTVQDGEMSGPSASFLHDAQQLKPGFALFIYQCISAFNYILLVLKSWIRVLKCWWQCAKGPFWQAPRGGPDDSLLDFSLQG